MNTKFLPFALLLAVGCQSGPAVTEWVSTSFEKPWQNMELDGAVTADPAAETVEIDLAKTEQSVDAFGTCFNELNWDSLKDLTDAQKDEIFSEMFEPGKGANFTYGRMSIGANDFALDYFSLDDTDGDFELNDFSIDRDRQNIIPMIRWAQKYNPDFRMWASPWCPPKWMKNTKHYAERAVTGESAEKFAKMLAGMQKNQPVQAEGFKPGEAGGVSNTDGFFQSGPMAFSMMPTENDAVPGEEGHEGETSFNMDPRYLDTYARYFGKFVDAYKAEGIDIFRVMPQNEFNSAQPYPACCWTVADINTFVGKYLGPEMEKRGVDVYFGTMERADYTMVETVLQDPDSKKYVKGAGFQWAGKDALPKIHELHPDLTLVQSEQECGNGMNNWEGAMHSWELMKHYFGNGINEYYYWNTSLVEGKASRWGWHQNSLVTVNEDTKEYSWTPEYYTLKHASHYVLPGAKYLRLGGSYEDAMAFVNTDGSVAVLLANQTEEPKSVSIVLGDRTSTVSLPAKSLNTIVIASR